MTEIALEKNEQPKKESKLEKELKFSWGRVMKRGLQNMKDDVDPVYKGAKMGFHALHSIPTWRREYKDKRLVNDSHGWAAISGTFVAGTMGLGYFLATNEAVAHKGPIGYAVLGVPLIMQGLSYIREAFRRAKKTELEDVVKSRLQTKIETASEEEFDLTVREVIDIYATNHASRRKKDGGEVKTDDKIEAYQNMSANLGRLFDDLYAHNQFGKKFKMTPNLRLKTKYMDKHGHDWYTPSDQEFNVKDGMSQKVWKTVSENDGSAEIEFLGRVKLVYDSDARPHYQVTPNDFLKK